MRHYVAMSVYLALGFALLMTIGFGFANEPILRLMNYSDQIMPDVKAYMGIIYAGLLVTAAYNSLAAFLRALGDSKSPLYFLIISAVINVALDVAFIILAAWESKDVRMQLSLHRNLCGTLSDLYYKEISNPAFEKEDFKISLSAWGRLLALGIPMALQFSITAIGTIIVQGAINVYGENAMAGFSAASKLQNIIMTVFVAFGATIATYVGQNRGAGKMDRVRQGVRCTQFMIWGYSIFAMVLVFFFGRYMTWLFINPSETAVVSAAVTYFRMVFWCYPFLGSIFLYRNTLQGLGYGLVPMLGGVFELIARAAIVYIVSGRASFAGVCLADPAAWISALIPLVPYYFYIMRKTNQ